MSTPTPDYGEPWKSTLYEIHDRMDFVVGQTHSQDTDERIIACCNALAGVQDPTAHLANLNATIEQQAETLQSAIELIRRVSTGPATPNDAWQWLKQRGLDEYQHINPDRNAHDQHA